MAGNVEKDNVSFMNDRITYDQRHDSDDQRQRLLNAVDADVNSRNGFRHPSVTS